MRAALVLTLVLFSAPTALSAAPKPTESWGKADVAFDAYRRDAVECGREAYYSDVASTPQAQTLVRATRQLAAHDGTALDPADPVNSAVRQGVESERIRASARVEKQMRELRKLLDSRLAACLTARGYSRFTLTEQQREELGKLAAGSAERHRFLHALAANPAVLAGQAAAASH